MAYLISLFGFITIAKSFLPPELNDLLMKWWVKLIRPVNPYCIFHIPEVGSNKQNDLYRVVQLHMRAAKLSKEADELVLSRDENDKEITFSLAADEVVKETYEGVTVWWSHRTEKSGKDSDEFEKSSFELKMRKKDKEFVMTRYLDFVTKNAAEFRRQLRELHLYSNMDCFWEPHNFKHPSNFDTLAMEPELKAKVKADLDAFLKGEQFFHKVGRAWKRGYLLYGPPGTGKSSMIAAIANYMKYNVYDLELTQVYDNNALKQLLVNTTSKSIIVIEDIDCSLDLAGQRKTAKEPKVDSNDDSKSSVTLSGLLNFTDGLWSCCGDERIIIFTTNHVEKLDAALLRPGRMDMHINMSYCQFETFKALVKNYLGIDSHPLFDTVKALLESRKLITPAQVAEHLFENRADPDAAMKVLIQWLEDWKPEEPVEETKAPVEETTTQEQESDSAPATSTPATTENGVTDNGITENGVAENGVTDNGDANAALSDDLRKTVSILEERVGSIENTLKQQLDSKTTVMKPDILSHIENGDSQVESDSDV